MAYKRIALIVVAVVLVVLAVRQVARAVTPAACANAKLDFTLRNLTLCGTCTGPGCPGGGFPSGGPTPGPTPISPIINPLNFGCHNDYNGTDGQNDITTTAGSTTLTATHDIWHDVPGNSDRNKVIRIENTGNPLNLAGEPYNTYVGTIVGVTNGHQIVINPAYPATATGEAGDSAEWGTADDTCMTNIAPGYIGNTTQTRALNVYDPIPIILTQPVLWRNVTGQWVCNGMGIESRDRLHEQGGFIWFGRTPDQAMITVNDGWGFKIQNCQVIGATSAPPQWGIRWQNPTGAGNLHPNAFNSLDHVAVGGFGLINMGPNDNGQGVRQATMTIDHLAHDTSITVASGTLVADLPYLGPGAPVMVIDPVGGNELAYTSDTIYTRGANPIELKQGLGKAHKAADTKIVWGVAPIVNGVGTDWGGTQNDRNDLNQVSVRNADTALILGHGLPTINARRFNANGAMIGIAADGGQINIDTPQWDGTCWTRVLSNNVKYVELGGGVQRGAYDACGPGQVGGYGAVGPVPGLGLEFLFNVGSMTNPAVPSGHITLINSIANYGRNSSADGTIIDLGSGQGESFRWQDMGIVGNQAPSGLPPAGIDPAMHMFPTGNTQPIVDVSYYTNLRTPTKMTIIDGGASDNSSMREYTIAHTSLASNSQPTRIHKILRGAETWTDVMNEQGIYGDVFTQALTVQGLEHADKPVAITCATAGATTYYYKIAWGIHQPNGTLDMGLPSDEASVANCAATVNATDYITAFIYTIRGADTMCYYRSTTPQTEQLAGCVPVGYTPDNGHNATSFKDETPAASLGATVPTVDNTGAFWTQRGNVQADPEVYGDILSYAHTIGQVATAASLPSWEEAVAAVSPAAWIRLDEAAGNFADSSGNGNTCTASPGGVTYGQPSLVTDSPDLSAIFDGASGYCQIATSATMPAGDTFSTFVVIKPTTTVGAIQQLAAQIANGYFFFIESADGRLVLAKNGGGTVMISVRAVPADGRPHLVGVVKNGAVGANLYIDNTDVSGTFADQTMAPANGALNVGFGGATQWYGGGIDEFVTTTHVVTPAEELALFRTYKFRKNGVVLYALDTNCMHQYISGSWHPTDCGTWTVASAPACNASRKYGRGWMTNADGCEDGKTPVSTGPNNIACPVGCDGTAWRAFYGHGTPTATATPSPTATQTPVPTATPT